MHSVVDRHQPPRDRKLSGLHILLEPRAATQVFMESGVAIEKPLSIEYIRYKPERRCIALVKASTADGEFHYVLRAFTDCAFTAQRAKIQERFPNCPSWHSVAHRIRIDPFPFDPDLRHIQKVVIPSNRQRLLRKILHDGKDNRADCGGPPQMDGLAYKPSRRYVSCVTPQRSDPDSLNPQLLPAVFKFYSASQFEPTRRRLISTQNLNVPTPRILATHAHYRVIALEWVTGQLLDEQLWSGSGSDSLLREVGLQLSQLHESLPDSGISRSHPTHDLHELAHYISLICPQLAKLATLVVNQTMTRLSSLRPTFGMIHGDFYGKQVLVQDSQIRFIDFDQAGIGDRYQDIANFIAKLYWRAMQLSDVAFTDAAERAAELADSFLAGVITGFPSLNVAACKAHLAAALIRCATHPFRRARNNWAAETELLLKLAHSKLNSHATL